MPRDSLEMKVVRSRSPAAGSVVEDQIVGICGREIQHVREMVPYRLRQMRVADYHEMSRENGIRIDLYVVEPALAPLEFEMELLARPVLLAQEARPCGYGLGRGVRSRGDDPRGIVLYSARKPADVELPAARGLERPEIAGGQRPYGQLVLYEFVQFVCHRSACSILRIFVYSDWKLGVRMPLPYASMSSASFQ